MASTISFPLLFAVSVSVLASLALAQQQQQPIFIPPATSAAVKATVQECMATVMEVVGCYAEIMKARTQMTFMIGPVCCTAIEDIAANCWPKIFPFDPFFPPTLKNYCARYHNEPSAAPKIAPVFDF